MKASMNLLALGLVLCAGSLRAAEPAEGVALAIVYDTSGSMRDAVKDAKGVSTPKYLIANRALVGVTDRIDAFMSAGAGEPRVCQAALFAFRNGGPREAIKLAPFEPAAFRDFAKTFSSPDGSTPLGNTLATAVRTVLASPLPRKHVLVITDGMNTAGPEPAEVLPGLQSQAQAGHTPFSVHLVAFDVDARIFAPLKRLGVTVVPAADERQLTSQLDFILQKKILLEDEDPK